MWTRTLMSLDFKHQRKVRPALIRPREGAARDQPVRPVMHFPTACNPKVRGQPISLAHGPMALYRRVPLMLGFGY